MTVFGDYAKYYNVLYRDKEYGAETAFVLDRLTALGCAPSSVLDLGCGTGRHGVAMAREGIAVFGVDMSEVMLSMATGGDFASVQKALVPEFFCGDARTVRLGRNFDAVTALFHVMSYQNTEEDALALMETARTHLRDDGIFLFDFWHGPGVLSDGPTERDMVMEDEATIVRRHAHPVHRVNDNVVDVHYTIRLRDKQSNEESELSEVHSMRYWFLPELRYLARNAGFSVVGEGAWLSAEAPSVGTWNAWMALRR